eukprot:9995560-Alexandrium_andersonii.AAC.1
MQGINEGASEQSRGFDDEQKRGLVLGRSCGSGSFVVPDGLGEGMREQGSCKGAGELCNKRAGECEQG